MDAVAREKISGNGYYTQQCQLFIEKRYGIKKALLTSSCTDALEMSAILIDVREDDEIIMPSYTFVSTANAFVLRGARVVFADSSSVNPNLDLDKVEALITKKTKAIVVVHYAGFCCDMNRLMAMAKGHNLFVIEDAAQAIESTFDGRPLGSIGHLACLSFHETKNIVSGEGGALLINDEQFIRRAEVIWEKGTNRSAFFRGEVDKYSWIDIGSSFLPSDITAAFLFAQLEAVEKIQNKRMSLWNYYFDNLMKLAEIGIGIPDIPDLCRHNGHIFYLVCRDISERNRLLTHLNANGVNAIFHYLSLHKSSFYASRHEGGDLPQCDRYSDNLVRLPLFIELSEGQLQYIISTIEAFFYERTDR